MTNYYGVVAEFESAADIYHAAEKVTAEGYTRVDSHTPFIISWASRTPVRPQITQIQPRWLGP